MVCIWTGGISGYRVERGFFCLSHKGRGERYRRLELFITNKLLVLHHQRNGFADEVFEGREEMGADGAVYDAVIYG